MTIHDEMKLEDKLHDLDFAVQQLEKKADRLEKLRAANKQALDDAEAEDDEEDDAEDMQGTPTGKVDYPPTAAGGSVEAHAARCPECGKRMSKCLCKGLGGGDSMKRERLRRVTSRAAAKSALASKCLVSVSKGGASQHSRTDYEQALDHLADAVAKKFGISQPAAYNEVLQTSVGAALYDGYCSAVPAAAPPPAAAPNYADRAIAKAAPRPPLTANPENLQATLQAVSKGDQVSKQQLLDALDSLAMAEVAKSATSVNFYQAYNRALDSPAGQALYKAYDLLQRG